LPIRRGNGDIMVERDRWVDRAVWRQLDLSNLTAERERHLLRVIRGDGTPEAQQAAQTELWESHSKLVVAIASRYRRFNFDLMDLVGAGHLGLHAAIAKFEPDRFESRLSTYAAGWIRWYIQNYIRRNAGPVRLPESNAHRQLSHMSGKLLADARRSCERECVEPTESELCERISRRIGMPAVEVGRSLKMLQGATVSLDHRAGDTGSDTAWAETLTDETADPEDEVILRLDQAKARKRILALAADILGERERIVFFARCMTDREKVPQLETLAARFGVSRERIHQLENSARRKIATALSNEGFSGFAGQGQVLPPPPRRGRPHRVSPVIRHAEPVALRSAAG